jgi:hydrogenase 3 maturation protease
VLDDLNKLISQENKRILFVGVGNLLKSDDGVGVYITGKIENRGSYTSLNAEVSIENYIGKINTLNPDILIIIDCVEMKSLPGTCRIFSPEQTADLTFNTHNISLNKLSDFFMMPVFILGIQPEKVDFGENISYLVKEIADRIIRLINTQEVHYGSRISM